VTRVYNDSPAAKAGLQPGDVITAVDGFEAADPRSVLYRLTTRGIGKNAELSVVRRGRRFNLNLKVVAPPKPGRDDVRNLSGDHPLDGARVANLVPAIVHQINVDADQGVVILSVRPRSVAHSLGFKRGDVILKVGQVSVESVVQLERLLSGRRSVRSITIKRGRGFLEFRG
jgi:S1-C subfamily serine protease